MTVSTEPAPLSYNGDDSTTDFPITWLYFSKSHVVATLRDAADAETLWVLGTDYTLTAAGVEAGGTLTATVAPATGETLVIELDPPNTQDKSLPLGGPFPSANVEDGLDIAAQRDSKLEALFDRCLRVPRTDTQTGSLLDLPIDSSRAGKFLAFDANGKPSFSSGTGADDGLRTDLASTTTSSEGGRLVGGKRTETGAEAFTLHDYHQRRVINVFDFIPQNLHDAIIARTNTTPLTTYLQNAFNAAAGKRLYMPDGEYLSDTVRILSGTHLFTDSYRTVLLAIPTLASNAPLLRNVNFGSFLDEDIFIEGIIIDGNDVGAGGTQTRFTELVAFFRVSGLQLQDATIRNTQYIGAAVGGGVEPKIINCTFENLGYNGTTTNGGSALWFGRLDSDRTKRATIRGGRFKNNRWHGVNFTMEEGKIIGATFFSNQEAHVFTFHSPPNLLSHDVKIIGNLFDTITIRDISGGAVGLEGGHGHVVKGNTIKNCDCSGIALTNVHDAVIEGNIISNFNNLEVGSTVGSGVDIISNVAAPDQPRDILVQGNRIFDDRTPVKGLAAISLAGAGDAAERIQLLDNSCAGTAWVSGGPLILTKFGAGSVRRGNLGTDDSEWTAYTPTVTSGSGTLTTAAATGHYLVQGHTVHIQITVTITTNGTGATSIDVTYPSGLLNVDELRPLSGHLASGVALSVFAEIASNKISMLKYDGTYPGADGAILRVAGSYHID